jgi:two-component system sensor histidine kinase KdpD
MSSGDMSAASRAPGRRSPLASYAWSVVAVAGATAVAWPMFGRLQTSDLALVYLLATIVVATRFGRGPSVLASALGVAVFDFCFVPPYFSLAVRDDPYLLTFVVMLVVGLTVSTLATRAHDQAEAARSHARWTATLHALSHELAGARDPAAIGASGVRQVEEALGGTAAVFLPGEDGSLSEPDADGPPLSEGDREAARQAFALGAAVTRHTGTSGAARAMYLPLRTASRTLGVLAFHPPPAPGAKTDPSRQQMLEALAQQVAGALERALLAEESKLVELRARTEELRNALLSSVSHDLRTPLAAITGSATTLLQDGVPLAPQQADLVRTIQEEAERLNRLVTNLLAMTRVAGGLEPRKEWVPLEEIVGSALERLGPRLQGRIVQSRIPEDLPLVPADPVLVEQVLVNLLENASRHTPAGTPIDIAASRDGDRVRVEVFDRGPGLAPGTEARVFEKFFRGPGAPAEGSGLGLTICRGIVAAHGGTIEAANRPEGGASFRFTLPIDGQPPPMPEQETRT